ncbi:Protein-S-isoprenylcysteine O-methyltransferase [Trichoplax sp. H2]|nr:Protein-S-isoprenylcysteine O-methyltransferase [Trichoplax sp. H2]|eukprot:RDD42394.1 Protein-S-isoprenylcysteine O-methyltransferase [Trichoplax sp. H2]
MANKNGQYEVVGELRIATWGFLIGLGLPLPYIVIASTLPTLIGIVLIAALGILKISNLIYRVRSGGLILVAATFLGLVFSFGLYLVVHGTNLRYLGFYLMSLSFFHWSEYATTALFNAEKLSMDSFLLNHSKEYGIAAVSSWIEYFIELYFFPQLKSLHWLSCIGIIMAVCGEFIRKRSMFVAASNFSHVVATKKASSHELVTHDVYSLCRHPSYFGWFWWSVGTQVILCNPICCIGYAFASWNFFNGRIQDEEAYLLQFFGQEYLDYMSKVGVGIPFIHGLSIKVR